MHERNTEKYLEGYLQVSENCLLLVDEIVVCCFSFSF